MKTIQITTSQYVEAMKPLKPKKGDLVTLCYDGKWGRTIQGTVLKVRGFAIFVEFKEWADGENLVRTWFVRTSRTSFGAFVKVDKSIMKAFFGRPGDWYTVLHIDVYKLMQK